MAIPEFLIVNRQPHHMGSVSRWFVGMTLVLTSAIVRAEDRDGFTTREGRELRDALLREAERPGKPEWKPMLLYLAELHGRSIQPATAHFPHPFQSIGPGYQGGRAFGHIDLAHERLDTVRAQPSHVRRQTENELAGQQADGLIPGVIVFDDEGRPQWKDYKGFSPFWVVPVDEYVKATSDTEFLATCLDALCKQIGWFENKRRLEGGGFYYLDATGGPWESGMDEGVRYDDLPDEIGPCVDACSHLFLIYTYAVRWSRELQQPDQEWQTKADELQQMIQEDLWDPETGFFYDGWVVKDPERRPLAFEGMWPVFVGAATNEQAMRVIDEHLLNPAEFFSKHPISTVAQNDPKHELRMWRGPAWNCMTNWAARGCLLYGRRDEARQLLEAALDATAVQFERTGTIWEFYHPQLGGQYILHRKDHGRRTPCIDYIGHNPLFAMVDLWCQCRQDSLGPVE